MWDSLKKKEPKDRHRRTSDTDQSYSVTIDVARLGDSISSSHLYMFPGSWHAVKIRKGNAKDERGSTLYRMPDVTPRQIMACFSSASGHRLMRVTLDEHGGENPQAIGATELDRRLSDLQWGLDKERPLSLAIVPP